MEEVSVRTLFHHERVPSGQEQRRGNLHDGRVGSSSHTYLIFVHNIYKIHGGMDFYNTVSLFVENVFR